MTLFLSICLLLMPWIIIPLANCSDFSRLPKATFFDLTCLGIICLGYWHGLKFSYRNKYLSALIIWLSIIITLNWYFPYTLIFDNRQLIHFTFIEPMLHSLLAIFATYVALCYFDEIDYEKFAKILCLSTVLVSGFCLLQFVGLDPYGNLSKYYGMANRYGRGICAFLDNPNIVGNYLCLCLPFLFYFKPLRYKLAIPLVVLTLLICKSVLPIIVSIIIILLYLFLKYYTNKVIIICLSFISLSLLSFAFIFRHLLLLKLDERLVIWKHAWGFLKVNPLFGNGLNSFPSQQFKTTIDNYTSLHLQAHNDWLQLACEIGVLGVVLIILVLINTIRNFNIKSNIGRCYFVSLIGFLLLMLGSFPLYIAPTALVGLLNFWAVEKL